MKAPQKTMVEQIREAAEQTRGQDMDTDANQDIEPQPEDVSMEHEDMDMGG
jgi:hypothetical protein